MERYDAQVGREARLVHVKQLRTDLRIPASIEMALWYADPACVISQTCLAAMLMGRQPDFDVYEKLLNARFSSDRPFEHLSVEHAATEIRAHSDRRTAIWEALEGDSPVLLSVPVPRGKDWHIRMCICCDDAGVEMMDPGLERCCRPSVKWDDIATAVDRAQGGGDVLVVRNNRGIGKPRADDGRISGGRRGEPAEAQVA